MGQPKVAAQSRTADPLPTVAALAIVPRQFRRRAGVRNRWVPSGTMHLYVDGASATGCGLALDTLILFPEIDWPGGVALSNPRCGACGELIAGA